MLVNHVMHQLLNGLVLMKVARHTHAWAPPHYVGVVHFIEPRVYKPWITELWVDEFRVIERLIIAG